MSQISFERVTFLLSTMVLMVLYGYGSNEYGWFPGPLLDRAVAQADQRLGDPHYVTSRTYDRHGVRIEDASAVAPGFTLISTAWKDMDWGPGLKLIDRDGATVHQWRADPAELFPDAERSRQMRLVDLEVHGSFLFPNGDVLVDIAHAGIARFDACGKAVWRLPVRAHHSIARADDGTFWVPISEPAARASSQLYPDGYPGLSRPVNDDRILHLTEDGEELGVLSVLDVLFQNGLQRYLRKGAHHSAPDILHINDAEPLGRDMADEYPLFEEGDLLLSLREPDLVLVVDPESLEVRWHASDPFIQQHDPDFIGGGWIGVFDNNRDGTRRGIMLGGSRIVAVQPHTDSLNILFPTPESEPFYTPFLGKWQILENGNMLLTEGTSSRLVEVAPDGRTVWEWIHEPIDDERSMEVTEGTRYSFTAEEIADWPCTDIEPPRDNRKEI